MKHRRLALVPALVLLLALPLAADVRSVPVADGPPPASIEGTITHVGVPIASPGPIVTLLGGLVSFDAEGASVRYADGTAATTASLAAGQRIVAFLDPAASPLEATSIVIFQERADVTLTGSVEAVDVAAGTLKLLGLTVKVTERTVFGGPWDGAGQAGLDDVKAGDLVLVAAKAQEGSLVASRVLKLSPTPMPTVRLHGVVASIGTESWTLTLADGSTATVRVDARTKLVGEPGVGDEVDVLARKQSDGSLLAVLIQAPLPPPVPTERYTGMLKELSPTSATVGPRVGDGPDRLFVVNEATRLVGDPRVGDDVGVLAQKQADGSLLAVVIAKLVVVPPVAEVAFDGVLKSTSAGDPGAASGGVWLVDETKVVVTRSTVVRGSPKVGDRVHVEGLKGPDGTVVARLVAKL
jgi:hypothetical protein